eukprot:3111094-Pleurochrysis_carterae.AAC.1
MIAIRATMTSLSTDAEAKFDREHFFLAAIRFQGPQIAACPDKCAIASIQGAACQHSHMILGLAGSSLSAISTWAALLPENDRQIVNTAVCMRQVFMAVLFMYTRRYKHPGNTESGQYTTLNETVTVHPTICTLATQSKKQLVRIAKNTWSSYRAGVLDGLIFGRIPS